MNNVEIVFRAWRLDNEVIPNHILYELRKNIASMFEDAGLGMIQEREGDKFANDFIQPIIDDYYTDENILVIFYNIPYPFVHGSFSDLLTDYIPHLFERLQHELDLKMDVRIKFS